MAGGLIYKLTNFLMPLEEDQKPAVQTAPVRPNLTVHHNVVAELKMFVAVAHSFDDVRLFADRLKRGDAIVVNYEHVDQACKQRIGDFLNGVCYILGGAVQKISETSMIYVPAHASIAKELYAYAIPTYVKQ